MKKAKNGLEGECKRFLKVLFYLKVLGNINGEKEQRNIWRVVDMQFLLL